MDMVEIICKNKRGKWQVKAISNHVWDYLWILNRHDRHHPLSKVFNFLLSLFSLETCPSTTFWWDFPGKSRLELTLKRGICVSVQFSSVQSLSHVRLFATPWTAARQASLSITNSQRQPKPMSIKSVMPSNHLILCHPLLLLPSIFPRIIVFSDESVYCMRWPKYWSFSFNISPSNEHPGLISFRMDWLDLLAVQGTLKSLLQHHSSKASIFQRWAFFTV